MRTVVFLLVSALPRPSYSEIRANIACDCPDQRTFKALDSIAFQHPVYGGLMTGTIVSISGCSYAVYRFQLHYTDAFGRLKSTSATDSTRDVCGDLMKLVRRSDVAKAFALDGAQLKSMQAEAIPPTYEGNSEGPAKRPAPQDSGDLLQGDTDKDQPRLAGGWRTGDIVYVAKDIKIKEANIPRETFGVVLGPGGKNGAKLRVAFEVYGFGSRTKDIVRGLITLDGLRVRGFVRNEATRMERVVDPDDLQAIAPPVRPFPQ